MICPNCQKDQAVGEQNYGALYTCPSCQAVYFINFDGVPEYGELAEQDLNEFSQQPASAPEGFNSPESGHDAQTWPESGSFEPLVPSTDLMESLNYEQPVDSSAGSLDSLNSVDNPFEAQSNLSAMNSDFSLDNNNYETTAEEVSVTPPPVAQVAPAKPKPTLAPQADSSLAGAFADIAQEISDFGNTDSQLAGLNYDLVISGIDTQETKNLFKEAIEDSKFAWDAFEIMKSLKNGRVEIKKLSPAKAYLLAKRIQFLDIEKVWKQNVLG